VGEWIVEFVAAVDEARGRALVTAHGGQIRRRMRSDGALTLLVRGPAALGAALAGAALVARVEENGGGYETR
jgi:hypothetical protein